MSSGARVGLDEARHVADGLLTALAGGCERIMVAGSIRCGRLDVGDVELVAIPRLRSEPVPGLWDDEQRTVNLLWRRVDEFLEWRVLAPHPTDPKRGERYQKLVHASGIQVDIFTARADTWGVALLIRTGPASYSHRFVVDARRHGFHVAEGFELHEGALSPTDHGRCTVIPTREEQDVYDALGLPWLRPEERR